MGKFIGIITDKSYYQQYSRYDVSKNRTYYFRICSYCEKEIEDGWTNEDSGMTVGAQHSCPAIREMLSIYPVPRIIAFEWGQFIFRKSI